MIAWLLLVLPALAGDHHVVAAGETIASISAELAPRIPMEAAALASALRAANGLEGTAEPLVGAILIVPAGGGADNASSVTAVVGTGTIEGGGLAKMELVRGIDLPAGATVCTAKDSYATIRLAMAKSTPEAPTFSHDDVSLSPETCLTITGSFTREGSRSSLVTLSQGNVTVRSADETPGVVTVVTPTGVSSGGNGGFRVAVENNASRTEAIDDAVGVFGGGAQVDVTAGEGTRVEAGQAPQAPIRLLSDVSLTKPMSGAYLIRPDFYWQPVERAIGYQIELSTESDFSEIIAQEQVDVAEWHPEVLLLPFRVAGLYWHVSSMDRAGFLGTPSETRELRFPEGVGP